MPERRCDAVATVGNIHKINNRRIPATLYNATPFGIGPSGLLTENFTQPPTAS
jgi:hypothetical protein